MYGETVKPMGTVVKNNFERPGIADYRIKTESGSSRILNARQADLAIRRHHSVYSTGERLTLPRPTQTPTFLPADPLSFRQSHQQASDSWGSNNNKNLQSFSRWRGKILVAASWVRGNLLQPAHKICRSHQKLFETCSSLDQLANMNQYHPCLTSLLLWT